MPAPTVTLTSRATRSHLRISRLRPSLLKRYGGSRSSYRDASSISGCNGTEAFREDFRQRARVARCYPQSQQVTFALRLSKVLERGSIVENRVVVHKLYIAGLELHRQIQVRIVRQFVEQIQSFNLKGTERCDSRKAAGRLDILSLIDCGKQTLVPVENRNGEVGFAGFRNFTTSIRFNRGEQNPEEIRPAAPH